MSLFPQLIGQPCGYLNLNDLAQDVRRRRARDHDNPFIDPEEAAQEIARYHERAAIAWSYGGYLERRETVWEHVPYLEKRNTFLHLGVDFTVPAGTRVSLTRPGSVVQVDDDHPDAHGWGPRVIVLLKHCPVCLIYAHLGRITCRKGDELSLNHIIGEVGTFPFNGGCFPHLHVQAMTYEAWKFYQPRLSELDGYGPVEDKAALARKFPDPLPYLRIW